MTRKTVTLFFSLLLGAHVTAHAENIVDIYQIALSADPTLQAAQAALESGEQAVPIAIARMLPTFSGAASTTGHDDRSPSFSLYGTSSSTKYNTNTYSLSLTQPILHREHWALLNQAKHNKYLALATYESAVQDLILRVAERYFAVLAAEDDLSFAIGQRKAFDRQLEQTQQRFDVGLIAITDVHEARARRDDAAAKEIAARNELADRYEQLREITGIPNHQLARVKNVIDLIQPTPNNLESWVDISNAQNLDLEIAKQRALVAKAEITNQSAGHWPSVDGSAAYQNTHDGRNYGLGTNTPRSLAKSASLSLTVPIFQGGGVIFQTKQARANYEQAHKTYEIQLRNVDSTARQSFRGVLTAISSVKALKQSVISNQSAVKATQAAYEVGTRTIVDVLDAESNLLRAIKDHDQARYQYILESLRLKKTAGTLSGEDIYQTNTLLEIERAS
jgi:outer membrane protein